MAASVNLSGYVEIVKTANPKDPPGAGLRALKK